MSDRSNIVRLPATRSAPAIEPFTAFYASQMEGRTPKPRDWIIDGVLLRRSVMLFAGAPKIGKSILLQQLLTATALGQPWLDRDTVQAKSFGMFAEDSNDELQRRQADINALYDRSPADFELDLSWRSIEGKPGVMIDFERNATRPTLTPLWHQVHQFVANEGIQVVGLDNARVIFGGSENFPNQVTAAVRLLVEWAIEIDGAIILLSHPNRSDPKSFAGTGAWHASVRAGMTLHRPRDWDADRDKEPDLRDPRRVLSGLGANYGAGIGTQKLEIRDGVFVPTDDHGGGQRARRTVNENNRTELRYRLLMGLKRQLQHGNIVPADVEHKNSMPHRARRSPDGEINWVPMNDLYRLQDDLIDAGQVVLVEVGKKVLLRPADGPYYRDEIPYLPAPRPENNNGDGR